MKGTIARADLVEESDENSNNSSASTDYPEGGENEVRSTGKRREAIRLNSEVVPPTT